VFSPNVSYHITVQRNGLALAQLAEAGTTSGQAIVQQSPVSPDTSDNWQFVSTTAGFYKVLVQKSGLALAVDRTMGGADGSDVIVTNSNSTDGSEDWCIVAVGSSNDGVYEFRNRQSDQRVTVPANTSYANNVVDVQAFGELFGGLKDNQKFRVEPANTAQLSVARNTWEAVAATRLVAATAANLPDGNILFWGSSTNKTYSQNAVHHKIGSQVTYTGLYNLATGTITERLVSTTSHNMYGAGTSSLSNGVLMVTGGGNNNATSFFDFRTNAWTIGPRLQIPRGFHHEPRHKKYNDE
jgi:hypothetical protein